METDTIATLVICFGTLVPYFLVLFLSSRRPE